MEIELERTFLLKTIPKGIEKCPKKEILDVYVPLTIEHPILRLRKRGEKMEMTKKQPIEGNDSSRQMENTIPLTAEEFLALSEVKGKKISKIRYTYPYQKCICEVDIFFGDLEGLAIVDFEFTSVEDKNNFQMPDFCLADVTQEKFMAGGMLCGKKYTEIEKDLEKFNYQKLS